MNSPGVETEALFSRIQFPPAVVLAVKLKVASAPPLFVMVTVFGSGVPFGVVLKIKLVGLDTAPFTTVTIIRMVMVIGETPNGPATCSVAVDTPGCVKAAGFTVMVNLEGVREVLSQQPNSSQEGRVDTAVVVIPTPELGVL